MRRFAPALCLLFARALAACGDGSVSGQQPPAEDAWPITRRDANDEWNELTEDSGCTQKGQCDDAGVDASVDARGDGARSDGPTAPDPCATRDDGTWCAALLGLPSTGLLRCASHRSAGVTPCMGGCVDRTGATDACLDDSIDPCFNEMDGLYCGRTIGAQTRPNDAFRCMYHRTTWTGPCPGGCSMLGSNLTCAP